MPVGRYNLADGECRMNVPDGGYSMPLLDILPGVI